MDLSPSTCLHWYYTTFKEKPINIIPNACKDNLDGTVCECCIDVKIREELKKNYEYKLASKRIYQIIIKTELFKQALTKENIHLSDDEIRKTLRRIASHKYSLERLQKRRTRKEYDLKIEQVLKKRQIGAMAVMKWFYLIKNHPELLKKAQNKEIEPDEVFIQSMNALKQDLIQGGEL